MSRHLSIIGSALLLLSSACNGVVLEETADEEALANVQVSDLMHFISTNPQNPDQIKIAAVNQKGTMCADGETRASCDVDVIDFSYAGMNEDTAEGYEPSFIAGKGVIFGWMQVGYDPQGELVTKLYAVEGWLDPTPGPGHLEFEMYDVSPVQIWCIRAPCPTLQAGVVNTTYDRLLHEVDLFTAGAEQDAVEEGYQQLASGHLLVSGVMQEYPETGEPMVHPEPLPGTRTLTADTFYLYVSDE